ncbi:MAG: PP2C family protein-serine/threonine phosphatase, partial [Acidobacteriota bacterium]|nr:PP2C family protein-serine/threonine phosphatase [Acidobacteriota bacterium]
MGPAAEATTIPADTRPAPARPYDGTDRWFALAPSFSFIAGWSVGWAVVGALVAGAIAFTADDMDLGPTLTVSILFAEVVGATALISARVIFPLFSRMPYALRLALQILTLFSGTVLGSVAVASIYPLFSLAQVRLVLVIVLVNATLAVVVGIALHTYYAMRRQIEQSYRILREKEALERELEIAREVQRELLPRTIPSIRGLDLAGACIPATGVGGDFYDFLPVTNDRLGLVIADVSGKGIPAALLMAGLQASVRSLAYSVVPPAEVNRRLNAMLLEFTSDARYATFFFAMYDAPGRRLTYSNAGHYPPLLVGTNGVRRLCADGPPIGILEGSKYGEMNLDLSTDDLLVLYTDGIVEAPNHDDVEFGEERLAAILAEHRGDDLEDVIAAVLSRLTSW